MDEALGVNPAQRMVADAKLAGVVGDDDGLPNKPSASIAPVSAASLVTRTGSGVTLRSAMPSARKWLIHCSCESKASDEWPASLSMMACGRSAPRMEAIAAALMTQRAAPPSRRTQESQARFARPGAERGEPVGADVGGETAFAGMARAGVVDGDEGRAPQPRPQHRFILGAEILELGGQKPHHLALGDHEPQAGQKRHDPLAGHLALKMKHQHQTNKMRARNRPQSLQAAAQSAPCRPVSPSARVDIVSFRPSAIKS